MPGNIQPVDTPPISINTTFNYNSTLGAAYAEAGKFEDAIAIQEQVIAKIKKISVDENQLDGYIERLKFYKAEKPWRDIR